MRRDAQHWAAGHITGGAFPMLMPFEVFVRCREGVGGRSV